MNNHVYVYRMILLRIITHNFVKYERFKKYFFLHNV